MVFIEEGEISWNDDNIQCELLIGKNNIRNNKWSSQIFLPEYFKTFRKYRYVEEEKKRCQESTHKIIRGYVVK